MAQLWKGWYLVEHRFALANMYQPATYILDYTQYDDPDLNESQKSGPKSPQRSYYWGLKLPYVVWNLANLGIA